MVYTFIGIALVCDEWFVPAIEVIVERIDMTPDAAVATFMAAGGSAPELFTSLIGTFISRFLFVLYYIYYFHMDIGNFFVENVLFLFNILPLEYV
eukprot:UN08218